MPPGLEKRISQARKKIEEDFTGALPYWEEHFDHWLFVHNSYPAGFPAPLLQTLLDLGKLHAPLQVGHFGFEELRQEFLGLNETDLVSLFGGAPSQKDMLHVRVKDLQIVFSAIARQQPAQSPDIRPVSPAKLQANALSASVQTLLTAGMTKSDAVGRLFHQWHDPTYGDSIAEAFRRKYEELRNSGLLPDLIFAELQAFAGGVPRGAPKHEAAVLAVLAFLFEECDIFESSRDGTT